MIPGDGWTFISWLLAGAVHCGGQHVRPRAEVEGEEVDVRSPVRHVDHTSFSRRSLSRPASGCVSPFSMDGRSGLRRMLCAHRGRSYPILSSQTFVYLSGRLSQNHVDLHVRCLLGRHSPSKSCNNASSWPVSFSDKLIRLAGFARTCKTRPLHQ
jgi:hypothetical protein